MIYEYRFYEVAEGRLAEEVDRMAEVAVRPADSSGKSLFDQHGVPRPKGVWTVLSGPRTPLFGYILRWDSLKQRDTSFPAFWADKRWHGIRDRARIPDRVPIVNRIDNWLMEPSLVWDSAYRDDNRQQIGGLQEMRIHTHYSGQAREAYEYLGLREIPHLQLMGACLIGAFDVVIGPKDAIVSFLSWPSFEARERAMARIDVETQLTVARERAAARFGRALFSRVENYLLEPTAYGEAAGNFGEGRETIASYPHLFPYPRLVAS